MTDGLLLVKNLYNDRVIFYWVNRTGKRVSTLLHTQEEAAEWWKKYSFSMYVGAERRRSVVDRRRCDQTREVMGERLNIAEVGKGRRCTDCVRNVDIDLYYKKLQQMIGDLN